MPQEGQDKQITLDEWERRTFERYGVPENLRRSILGQESGGNLQAKSPTGVRGRYQVTKATAEQYGYDRDDQWQQPVAAAKHLRTLYDGIKTRHPGFSDKQAWLGASAEYYYGGDAFDAGGNLSEKSRDGFSTPAKYATSIAERWSAYDLGESPRATTSSAPAPAKTQPQSTARRLGIKPFEWEDDKAYDLTTNKFIDPAQQSKYEPMRSLRPGAARDDLRSLRPSAPFRQEPDLSEFDYRTGGIFAADRARAERAALEIGPRVKERERKMEEFERRPWSERWSERIRDAVERGGSEGGRLVLRALGAGLGAAEALNSGRFEVKDVTPERFKENDERMARENAARREAYRPSFAGDVVEGIAEGAPIAAGATILGGLTGGGLPATMAIGGGLSAAGADWENDPERAAAQTILGAVAPVVGGKIGERVAGRVASRFSSPAAVGATRMAGEIGGGGAGNVLQSGTEQLAFEGRMDPRELAKQAAIGSGLSTPGALRSLRPSARAQGAAPEPTSRAAMEIEPSSLIRATGPATDEAAIRARLEAQQAPPPSGPEQRRLPFDAEPAARKIQHSQFGAVVEAADQSGVRKGHLRVTDGEGKDHIIKNPRTSGNREASFITAKSATAELPELAAIEDVPSAPGLAVRDQSPSATASGPRLSEAELSVGASAAKSGESHSLGKAIGNTLRTGSQAMRTLWTSMDLSAPMSQGAILSIAHPFKSALSFGKMFRSLSKNQSAAIDAEIANHPLLGLGEDHGLYVATSGKARGAPEESYALEAMNKLPVISHSERAFRTYLDTLRLSTWESYVKSLRRSGFTPENNPTAYRQAAEFINIATGRGSLKPGGKLEKAMDLGGDILFAPRNLVANFQVLDPIRYATLAPGARKVVLRDAMTAFGSMIGTAALLRAAGVTVGFDPEENDFMTARWGNHRYDLTFGKKTQVQFLARAIAGVYREATGDGNLPYKDPLSVSERFIRGKLAPIYSTAYTMLSGKDFTGEPIKDKSKWKLAWETAAPMLWRDLAEAYHEEGIPGVMKSSPAVFGARVSTYPDSPKTDWLKIRAEARAEQKRLGLKRAYLEPRKGESVEQFRGRKATIDNRFVEASAGLVSSPDFRNLDDGTRREAFAVLREAVGRGERGDVIVENVIARAMDRVLNRRDRRGR
jgi:hypothetical protein